MSLRGVIASLLIFVCVSAVRAESLVELTYQHETVEKTEGWDYYHDAAFSIAALHVTMLTRYRTYDSVTARVENPTTATILVIAEQFDEEKRVGQVVVKKTQMVDYSRFQIQIKLLHDNNWLPIYLEEHELKGSLNNAIEMTVQRIPELARSLENNSFYPTYPRTTAELVNFFYKVSCTVPPLSTLDEVRIVTGQKGTLLSDGNGQSWRFDCTSMEGDDQPFTIYVDDGGVVLDVESTSKPMLDHQKYLDFAATLY